VENPLLEKWRAHAKRVKRMHGSAHALYKGRADMALCTTVFLSLGVGCLNLGFGIGRPAHHRERLSLPTLELNNGLEWPNKAERHDHFASRFGEVVRDINKECLLCHLYDAEYASESNFLRHMSTEMSRLEESAPNIPYAIEQYHSTPKP
jgi:hypothetical protein